MELECWFMEMSLPEMELWDTVSGRKQHSGGKCGLGIM